MLEAINELFISSKSKFLPILEETKRLRNILSILLNVSSVLVFVWVWVWVWVYPKDELKGSYLAQIIMSLSLRNAPITYGKWYFLGFFHVVHQYDILLWFKTLEERGVHVFQLLQRQRFSLAIYAPLRNTKGLEFNVRSCLFQMPILLLNYPQPNKGSTFLHNSKPFTWSMIPTTSYYL